MSNKIKIDDVKGLFRCDYEGIWKKNYEVNSRYIIERVDQVNIGAIDKGTPVEPVEDVPYEVKTIYPDRTTATTGYMHSGPVFYTQLQHILNHLKANPSIENIRVRIEETINQGYVLYQP